MYRIEKIVENIINRTTLTLKETTEIDCYGLYYPTKAVIVYNPEFGDKTKVAETLIHELTHYIAEVEGKALDTFNNEILAYTAERVIIDNADIEETIKDLIPKIEYAYNTHGVVIYTVDEINYIINIVKKIIGDE